MGEERLDLGRRSARVDAVVYPFLRRKTVSGRYETSHAMWVDRVSSFCIRSEKLIMTHQLVARGQG